MQNSTLEARSVKPTTPNVLVVGSSAPAGLGAIVEKIVFLDSNRVAYRVGRMIFAHHEHAARYAANLASKRLSHKLNYAALR